MKLHDFPDIDLSYSGMSNRIDGDENIARKEFEQCIEWMEQASEDVIALERELNRRRGLIQGFKTAAETIAKKKLEKELPINILNDGEVTIVWPNMQVQHLTISWKSEKK